MEIRTALVKEIECFTMCTGTTTGRSDSFSITKSVFDLDYQPLIEITYKSQIFIFFRLCNIL